jgi:hypothetical protein
MTSRRKFWRTFAAGLVVATGWFGLTSCTTPSSGEISFLSYNVAGLPQEISQENPERNIPLISPLLNDYQVVMTQEDFDWWRPDGVAAGLDFIHYHERLMAQATHRYKSPRHPGFDGLEVTPERLENVHVGDGLAFFSRFPIQGNNRKPWTGCFGGFDVNDGGAADCLAIKGFSSTRMTLANGVQVDLYNLHGEAGGTALDQSLQEDDYEQLATYILANSGNRAIILGGDTNLHTDFTHPDGENGADIEIWENFLETTGLTDACDATNCNGPGRIDKFAFRSGSGVVLEALSHEFHGDEFVDETGDALSDHEPLEVRFAWHRP